MNRLASPRSRLLVLVLVAALPAFALTLYTRLEHRRAAGSPGSRPPSKTTCSRTRAGSHLPSPSCLRSGHSNPGRLNHLPINDAGEWGRFLRTVERLCLLLIRPIRSRRPAQILMMEPTNARNLHHPAVARPLYIPMFGCVFTEG